MLPEAIQTVKNTHANPFSRARTPSSATLVGNGTMFDSRALVQGNTRQVTQQLGSAAGITAATRTVPRASINHSRKQL
jgi:hypothetical protein